MYDEPLAVPETARGHYATCADCQGRFTGIADDARQMTAALAVPAAAVDADAAHRALQGRLQPRPRLVFRLPSLSGGFLRRGALVTGLAAVLVMSAVATPFAATVAAKAREVFGPPAAVAPVNVSQSSLAGFPDLSHWGNVAVTQQPELKQAATAADAAGATLPVIKPSYLPSGLPAAQYASVSQGAGSFTFSKKKADDYARSQGAKAPPLPSNLDGAVLKVSLGPAEIALYGGDLAGAVRQGTKSDTQGQGQDPAAQADLFPKLAIVATKVPTVSATGASVADIKNAVANQPGVSPELKKTILAIGDPNNTTLPIPILDGIPAHDTGHLSDGKTTYVYEGDSTLGGVVFIRGGNLWAVAGAFDEATLLRVANSL
jgi:hypothetical protein